MATTLKINANRLNMVRSRSRAYHTA